HPILPSFPTRRSSDLTIELIESIPELSTDIRNVSTRLSDLLETKRRLIRDFDAGRSAEVLEYVRSGKGIALSDAIRGDLRDIQEDRKSTRLNSSHRTI